MKILFVKRLTSFHPKHQKCFGPFGVHESKIHAGLGLAHPPGAPRAIRTTSLFLTKFHNFVIESSLYCELSHEQLRCSIMKNFQFFMIRWKLLRYFQLVRPLSWAHRSISSIVCEKFFKFFISSKLKILTSKFGPTPFQAPALMTPRGHRFGPYRVLIIRAQPIGFALLTLGLIALGYWPIRTYSVLMGHPLGPYWVLALWAYALSGFGPDPRIFNPWIFKKSYFYWTKNFLF